MDSRTMPMGSMCACGYPDKIRVRDTWVDGDTLMREVDCITHGRETYPIAKMECGHYQVGSDRDDLSQDDLKRIRRDAHARRDRKKEYEEHAQVIGRSPHYIERIAIREMVYTLTSHDHIKTGIKVVLRVSPLVDNVLDVLYSENDEPLRDDLLKINNISSIEVDESAKGYTVYTQVIE